MRLKISSHLDIRDRKEKISLICADQTDGEQGRHGKDFRLNYVGIDFPLRDKFISYQLSRTFEVITSFTPGRRLVDRLRIWVRTVETIMCQVVRKIGKGKLKDDRTALLNKI